MNDYNMSTIDKNIINLLRFPLALLVVYIHVDLITGNQFSFITEGSTPFLWNIDYFTSKILGSCCVPTFFLISGFLLFKNGYNKCEDWNVKFRKRIDSLFIPYLFWNVLFLCGIAIVQYRFPHMFQHSKLVMDFNFVDYVLCFVSMDFVNNGAGLRPFMIGPIDLPLWFVRDLMILVLIAPVIQYLLRKLKAYFLFVILLVWITGIISHILFIDMVGVCFFSLGAYLGISGIGFSKILKHGKMFVLLFLVTTLMQMCYKLDSPQWLIALNTFFAVFSFIKLAGVLVERNISIPLLCTNSTFFIYASHYLVSIFAIRYIVGIVPRNEFILIAAYLLVPILVAALLVACYRILPPHVEKCLQEDADWIQCVHVLK